MGQQADYARTHTALQGEGHKRRARSGDVAAAVRQGRREPYNQHRLSRPRAGCRRHLHFGGNGDDSRHPPRRRQRRLARGMAHDRRRQRRPRERNTRRRMAADRNALQGLRREARLRSVQRNPQGAEPSGRGRTAGRAGRLGRQAALLQDGRSTTPFARRAETMRVAIC